jgi:tetratricopeptide (TPR) repeat protein
MGRERLALEYARRAADLYPNRDEPWQVLSRLAHRLGDLDRALDAGHRALRVAPTAQSAVLLAAAQRELGHGRAAVETLRRALEEGYPTTRSITAVELLTALARAQLATGEIKDAKETLVRALGLAGTHRARVATVHRELAGLEERLGNSHRASWHREQASLSIGK